MPEKAKFWFAKAKAEKFALGSFNVSSVETLKAVVGAAKKLASPVMVEASDGEATYFGIKELVAMVAALEDDFKIPIILNLDHGQNLDICRQALVAGFDYVHLDGSKLPLEENIAQAKTLVKEAHKMGVLVEGEIDNINVLGAGSADFRYRPANANRSEKVYTDPEKAAAFVNETGVDTFASFVGNVHGLYAGPKNIDLDLLQRISDVLPDKYLSLHGGSGIPDEEVKAAIDLGVVKVNVNSELRVAFRDTLKNTLETTKDVATYDIMPEAIAEMQKIVESKILMFGSNNKLT